MSSPAADGTPCGNDACAVGAACVDAVCVPGAVVDFDADADGSRTVLCGGGDCDDSDDTVFPGAGEDSALLCSDGRDNDCDFAVDALDPGCGTSRVCDSGWCWENPLPDGYTGTALWPNGDREVWVGGRGVAHGLAEEGELLAFVNEELTFNGVPIFVLDLWGSSATDIWGVGYAQGNVLLHYDGAWSVAPAPVPGMDKLFGFASDDIWAVGVLGSVMHYDGVAWVPVHDATFGLAALHGSAPDDVWFGGNGSTLLHWDGAQFEETVVVGSSGFSAIAAVAADDVWASDGVGLMHFDGATWTRPAGSTPVGVTTLFAASSTDIWAGGRNGSAHHFDGATWQFMQVGGIYSTMTQMRGASGADVWAAGTGGSLAHFDGVGWSAAASRFPPSLLMVDVETTRNASGEVDAWATARDWATGGVVNMRRTADGVWLPDPGPADFVGFVITATSSDDVWFLGEGFAHFDGVDWTVESTAPGGRIINDACSTSPGSVWAVGSNFGSIDEVFFYKNLGNGWELDLELDDLPRSNSPPMFVAVFGCFGPFITWRAAGERSAVLVAPSGRRTEGGERAAVPVLPSGRRTESGERSAVPVVPSGRRTRPAVRSAVPVAVVAGSGLRVAVAAVAGCFGPFITSRGASERSALPLAVVGAASSAGRVGVRCMLPVAFMAAGRGVARGACGRPLAAAGRPCARRRRGPRRPLRLPPRAPAADRRPERRGPAGACSAAVRAAGSPCCRASFNAACVCVLLSCVGVGAASRASCDVVVRASRACVFVRASADDSASRVCVAELVRCDDDSLSLPCDVDASLRSCEDDASARVCDDATLSRVCCDDASFA